MVSCSIVGKPSARLHLLLRLVVLDCLTYTGLLLVQMLHVGTLVAAGR